VRARPVGRRRVARSTCTQGRSSAGQGTLGAEAANPPGACPVQRMPLSGHAARRVRKSRRGTIHDAEKVGVAGDSSGGFRRRAWARCAPSSPFGRVGDGRRASCLRRDLPRASGGWAGAAAARARSRPGERSFVVARGNRCSGPDRGRGGRSQPPAPQRLWASGFGTRCTAASPPKHVPQGRGAPAAWQNGRDRGGRGGALVRASPTRAPSPGCSRGRRRSGSMGRGRRAAGGVFAPSRGRRSRSAFPADRGRSRQLFRYYTGARAAST